MKTSAKKTRISETIAEIKENTAKSIHKLTDDSLSQRATIPTTFKNPDKTTRTRCILPL